MEETSEDETKLKVDYIQTIKGIGATVLDNLTTVISAACVQLPDDFELNSFAGHKYSMSAILYITIHWYVTT